jgi:hypothetical protein
MRPRCHAWRIVSLAAMVTAALPAPALAGYALGG